MFNLLGIASNGEWKTAFQTRKGLFEFLIMPFEIIYTPVSFQSFINNTLTAFLDRYITAYLIDILFYSDTLDEHRIS